MIISILPIFFSGFNYLFLAFFVFGLCGGIISAILKR